MARTTITWYWDEAFSKFGFEDGDGPNFTEEVASFIQGKGYETECDTWGMHNYMIMNVKEGEVSIIPDIYPEGHEREGEEVQVGYDNPREYLPKDLWKALDKKFGKESCF